MIELQMKGDCGVCGRYSGSIYVTFKVLKFHLRTTDKSLYFSTTQCNDCFITQFNFFFLPYYFQGIDHSLKAKTK